MTPHPLDDVSAWLRTDLEWTDVLLDCRPVGARLFTVPDDLPSTVSDPLPAKTPPQGPAGDDVTFEVAVHLAANEVIPERYHSLSETGLFEGFVVTSPHSLGHLLIRITYFDGFRVSVLSAERGETLGASPDSVWRLHLYAPRDGLGLSLLGERKRPQAASVGAGAQRRAVADPVAWYDGWEPGGDVNDVLNAAQAMYCLSTMGFSDYPTARLVDDSRALAWSEWLDAVEQDFDSIWPRTCLG